MQFKQDAKVVTPTGQVVGHVDRVVLNPNNKQVTHIVVQKGFLFTEDKIVPLALIESATDDRVTLRRSAGDLDKLPPFEETHYIPLSKDEADAAAYVSGLAYPLYWYPPMGGWLGHDYLPPFTAEVEQHIPEDTVAVKEGARVISSDNKHVGNVERVFTEPRGDRATYFVITQGLFLKERKLVPTTWIREVESDEIYLSVGSSVLDSLAAYEGTEAPPNKG